MGALLGMLRHGGPQPRREEGALLLRGAAGRPEHSRSVHTAWDIPDLSIQLGTTLICPYGPGHS